MPDKDKVLTALAICTGKCKCFGCWYGQNNVDFRCQDRLMEDALALLRRQEPVKPDYDPVFQIWTCGNCGKTIYRAFPYCPYCQREVKWDGDH